MPAFTKKKLKSKTLGEKLKEIRESTGVSLAEIAKNTRIRQDYLEKIEQEKFDELPPDVYVKGFLKNYANYLGIDAKEVLRQYEKEKGIHANLKNSQAKSKKSFFSKFPSVTITPHAFSAVAFSVILLAVFFYFYKELDKFSENPRLVLFQPTSDVSIEGNSFEIIGLTDKDNRITINEQPVLVNEKGEFKENIGLQKGINKIVVEACNKFDKKSHEEFNISAQYEVKIAGEETETENEENKNEPKIEESNNQSDRQIELEITVKEIPVWVSVRVDGINSQNGTMLPDSSQIFRANEKILVTSGKANKTFIKFNGKDVGVLDESPGVIRDVIFSKKNSSFTEENNTFTE